MQATAAYVETISDEDLGLVRDTDPAGTMIMSAKMVEIVKNGTSHDRWRQMNAYVDSLTKEEKFHLVAMADKHDRVTDDLILKAPAEAKLKGQYGIAYRQTAPVRAQSSDGSQSQTQPASSSAQSFQPTQGFSQMSLEQYPPINQPMFPNNGTTFPQPQQSTFHQLPSKHAPQPPQQPPPAPQHLFVPQPIPSFQDERPGHPQPGMTFIQPEGQPFIPNPFFDIPANQYQPQFAPAAAKPKKAKKNTEPKIKQHIRMIGGREPWDPVESLRKMPVVGLDFGSLMDMAPGARIAVGKALQIDKPPGEKKRRTTEQTFMDVSAVSVSMKKDQMGKVSGDVATLATTVRNDAPSDDKGVLAEPDCQIMNFHTSGNVWGSGYSVGKAYKIGKILIDGGAVVNLMPERIAERLGFELIDNNDIVIRTATDETRPIHKCTTFDLDIAGVTARIKVYVIDIPQSYSLLLGRRWLYQVRAFGDYSSHAYTIYDSKGIPHEVQPMGGAKIEPLPEVLLNPHKALPHTDLTDTEKEEISLGQGKMDAIISRIVAGAESRFQDWETEEESEAEEDQPEAGNGPRQ